MDNDLKPITDSLRTITTICEDIWVEAHVLRTELLNRGVADEHLSALCAAAKKDPETRALARIVSAPALQALNDAVMNYLPASESRH